MVDHSPLKSPQPDRAFALTLAGLAALHVVIFVYVVEAASVRVPVYDLLDWLEFYGERMRAGDWLGYLWTPHDGHRIVLSRILLAIDIRWFHGSGAAFAIFGYALLAAMAAAMAQEILKSSLSNAWKAVAIPLAVILLTEASIAVTIGMPAVGVFLHTSAFAVFALVLLDGAGECGRFATFRRTLSLVCACLAAFGVIGGLLIWPVLVWSAWRGHLGWRWLGGIVCVGVFFCALYVRGLPASAAPMPLTFAGVVAMFDYAIRFLGLPWSHLHALAWPARAIGFAILCLGIYWLVADAVSRQPTARLQRIGLALVLFALLLAAAAGLLRADVATDRETPIRYATFICLGHVGMLLYASPFLQRLWQRSPRRPLQALILVFAIGAIGQQIMIARFAIREARLYNDAWARFAAGEWTPDMLHYVYPDPVRARAMLADLKKMQVLRGQY